MRSLAIGAGGLILSATVLAVPPPAPPMPAKDAPAAEEIADLVVETMRSLGSVSFDAEYEQWEGDRLIARSRGSVLIESAFEAEGRPRFIVRGELLDPVAGGWTPFAHAFDGHNYFLVDGASRTVSINLPDRGGVRLADSRAAIDGLIFFELHHPIVGRIWESKLVTPIDRGPDPATGGALRMLFPRHDGIDHPLNWWWRVDTDTGLFHGYDFWWPDSEEGPPAGFKRLVLSNVTPDPGVAPEDFLVSWPEGFSLRRNTFPPFDENLLDRQWTNRMAPDWTFHTEEGEPVQPSASRGRVTLVYFWARGCEPCVRALPRLAALDAEHRARGLEIIAVSTWDEDLDAATDFLRERGCGFQSVASGTPHVKKFGARGLPNWMLIGPGGELIAMTNDGDMEELLKAQLARLNAS